MKTYLLTAVLVFLTLNEHGSTEDLHGAAKKGAQRQPTCPDASDIFPCVCTVYDEVNMDMTCSEVTSEFELAQVFSAYFPDPNFTYLRLEDNNNLQVLRDGALGTTTYVHIHITGGVLTEVEENALSGSFATLETLVLNYNSISTFPFHTLSSFTALKSLDMDNNQLQAFPQLVSSTLEYLDLGGNPMEDLPPEAFTNTPTLQQVYLYDTEITLLYPGKNNHAIILQ